MTNRKPLTKQDLVEALKKLPTEKKVNDIVFGVAHTILEGVETLLSELKDGMNSRYEVMNADQRELSSC
jgi:hypothetical protein